MSDKKKKFNTQIENQDVELAIIRPSVRVSKDAQLAYNSSFAEAVQSGALLKARLQNVLIDQGVWSFEKQKQNDSLVEDINDSERKLAKGGIKLSEAKRIALEMRVKRWRLRELIAERTEYETNTAEGQAENARFNYLVATCTVYNDSGDSFFSGLDDYLERSSEPAAIEAARIFANMMYGLEDNYEASLPENQFLIDYEFINEDLRLINKEGDLVDVEGKLINDEGRYVDEDGQYTDKDGIPVTLDGDYMLESKPFLDDSGKPIQKEDEAKEVEAEEATAEEAVVVAAEAEKPKPKKRGRPKKKPPTTTEQ